MKATIRYVGLDVHKDSTVIVVAEGSGRDHANGQRPCASAVGRGRVELPDAGPAVEGDCSAQ
jgi:hypothetical protein